MRNLLIIIGRDMTRSRERLGALGASAEENEEGLGNNHVENTDVPVRSQGYWEKQLSTIYAALRADDIAGNTVSAAVMASLALEGVSAEQKVAAILAASGVATLVTTGGRKVKEALASRTEVAPDEQPALKAALSPFEIIKDMRKGLKETWAVGPLVATVLSYHLGVEMSHDGHSNNGAEVEFESDGPTVSPSHAVVDTRRPTLRPSPGSPAPTAGNGIRSVSPTSGSSSVPSAASSSAPTVAQTIINTFFPTGGPTSDPTGNPTGQPTFSPTILNTILASFAPTGSPSISTVDPSSTPTVAATLFSSDQPSSQPTSLPSCVYADDDDGLPRCLHGRRLENHLNYVKEQVSTERQLAEESGSTEMGFFGHLATSLVAGVAAQAGVAVVQGVGARREAVMKGFAESNPDGAPGWGPYLGFPKDSWGEYLLGRNAATAQVGADQIGGI